ncbi:hypothetical protein PAXRUDRAFT_167376, partial [Paxillus rubicundulus Ve08.2h10]
KKRNTKDLLTIFSDRITIKFVSTDGKVETKVGQWCTVCKEDEVFVAKNGKCKAFYLGGNSSCHQHICVQYDLYQERSVKQQIVENNHAVPLDIQEERQAVKQKGKGPQQTSLEGLFFSVPARIHFHKKMC